MLISIISPQWRVSGNRACLNTITQSRYQQMRVNLVDLLTALGTPGALHTNVDPLVLLAVGNLSF